MQNNTNQKIAMRVSVTTIVINLFLFLFKIVAGILSMSASMISDAVHSASDIFSTVVVMIGVKLAGKEKDSDHNYGHERMECVAAIVLSVVLLLTGVGIGFTSIQGILNQNTTMTMQFSGLALIAAIVSILTKELMYWYTKIAGKKINSGALIADAWHHRSDALSSIGAFIGILGARLGYPILDKIFGVVICIFIIKVSIDIFRDAISKMTDKACDEKIVKEIEKITMSCDGVMQIDLLKTRVFGDKIYIDIEISANGALTLNEAHAIAEEVHDKIESQILNVKHCMVHLNPCEN